MVGAINLFYGVVSIIALIGAFIFWHFKTIHSFKEQVTDLKILIKELENKDNLQQQTLDQLKEFYPIIRVAIENLKGGKK